MIKAPDSKIQYKLYYFLLPDRILSKCFFFIVAATDKQLLYFRPNCRLSSLANTYCCYHEFSKSAHPKWHSPISSLYFLIEASGPNIHLTFLQKCSSLTC